MINPQAQTTYQPARIQVSRAALVAEKSCAGCCEAADISVIVL
jgi:hypothetical protein